MNFPIVFTLEPLASKPRLEPIDNVTVYVGSNVTVVCKAMSDALPLFQWLIFDETNNGSVVPKQISRQHQSHVPSSRNKWHHLKLFLPNVSHEDQRKYTCLAGNKFKFAHSSFFLYVLERPLKDAGMFF